MSDATIETAEAAGPGTPAIANRPSGSTICDAAPIALFLLFGVAFLWLVFEEIDATPVLLDEFAHIPAGVSYWETGRFSLYRESPPVVRCLVGLPAWLMGARVDYAHAGMGHRSEWAVGHDYLRANAGRYPDLLRRARIVVAVLGVVAGALIYWWAREVDGPAAGVACAALWLLDPGVVAFSGIATTDVGAACFGLVAAYAFWRFLRRPSWPATLLMGLALGLAQGTKFSMLALYPAWLAIVVVLPRFDPGGPGGLSDPRRPPWGRLAVAAGVSLVVLNALYLADGTLRPLGSFTFRSRLLTGMPTRDVYVPPLGNRFRDTSLADLPVPLPKDYVLGFDSQKWEEEVGFARLSGGRLVRGAPWYAPWVTFGQKRPLGTLALLAGALLSILRRANRLRASDGLFLATGLALMALLCTQTGLNWVDRYALPALPFLMLAAGGAVRAIWEYRSGRVALVACVAWNVVVLAGIRPSYLSFANASAGGPASAVDRFLGSNYDWGQDLGRLKNYLDRHPEVSPVVLSYYGVLGEDAIEVQSRSIPDTFIATEDTSRAASSAPDDDSGDFYWIISANLLNGLPIDAIRTESGIAESMIITSPLLSPENAVDRIGTTLYLFRIVPAHGPRDATRALSATDLRRCLRFADRNEVPNTP